MSHNFKCFVRIFLSLLSVSDYSLLTPPAIFKPLDFLMAKVNVEAEVEQSMRLKRRPRLGLGRDMGKLRLRLGLELGFDIGLGPGLGLGLGLGRVFGPSCGRGPSLGFGFGFDLCLNIGASHSLNLFRNLNYLNKIDFFGRLHAGFSTEFCNSRRCENSQNLN